MKDQHFKHVLELTFATFLISTSGINDSTQPIFGIIIAYFFLNEIPTWNTFFGGLLILSTVIIESLRTRKK